MPTDHRLRVEARVPRPRRHERVRSSGTEVTVADLMDRIRDEHGTTTVSEEGASIPWGHEFEQPTQRIAHRAELSRANTGPWIAGALASATVLSASLVVSHVVRPGTPANGAAGRDSSVSDAGNHTRYTPGGSSAQPRIPGPRPPASIETVPHDPTPRDSSPDGSTPDDASPGTSSPDDALPHPVAPIRADGGAHRAPDGWNADAGAGGRGRRDATPGAASGRDASKSGPDATSGGGSGKCDTPGDIVNLSNWKLTLPTGSGSSPTEVAGRALSSLTGSGNNWFSVGRGCAVAFRAPVNGVTTSGSKNPRSELREMSQGGSENAGWSSTSGTHTMVLKEAFTKLPSGKPQVVGGQIHDASDDISVFRLEGSKLYVTNGDDPHYQLVTSNYVLGTPFEAKYVVSGGVIRAYYNGRLVATLAKDFSGAYFKAGAYTQANCQDASPCSSANYGEVMVYSLRVTHT